MIKKLKGVIISFFVFVIITSSYSITNAAEKTNILFIGNSKTYYNDFAEVFMGLANKAGKNVFATDPTVRHGGKSLTDYIGFSDVKTLIKSKKWDYVIMQESTAAATGDQSKTEKGAKEIIQYVKNNSNSDVKVGYNATWVTKDLNKKTQNKADSNIEYVVSKTGGFISYSGKAFINCRKKYPKIDLFVDDKHPTPEGTYLSACCMYAAIYGESPEGIEYYPRINVQYKKTTKKISSNVASKLQKIAAETMNVKKNEAEIKIHNNREPRIFADKSNKNYCIIGLHDNVGIQLDKTSIKLDGKNLKLELIERPKGAYNQKGERITDSNSSEKRYDYGVKIPKKKLSNKDKELKVVAYDYDGNCFLSETFKIRKLKKATKTGKYYKVNRAPRMTVKVDGSKLKVLAVDYSGIKSVKVTNMNGEEIFKFSGKSSAKNSFKSGTINSKSYYKRGLSEGFSITKLNKAKIAENKYKLKVVSEDVSGIKSTKTMTITIK